MLGATGPVARGLVTALATDPTAAPRTISPRSPELVTDLTGVAVLFVVGPLDGPDLVGIGGSRLDLAAIGRVLAAASEAGVPSVVALSSALVYGAWPDNPVPLTEDAPLRPDPGVELAVMCAELERRLGEWAAENPSSHVAVLRPVVTVSGDRKDWFRRSPWSRNGVRAVDSEPPRQFLHLDDLVGALAIAWERGLDGAYNVAPDGWLPGDTFRDLEGPSPRMALGPTSVSKVARWRYDLGLTAVPPAVLAYTNHPWVVANDRLQRAGWTPGHSNEETFVEADEAGPLRSMSPRARQELSLVALGVVGLGALLAVVFGLRRWLRGRR